MAIYFTKNTSSVGDLKEITKLADKVNKANESVVKSVKQLEELKDKTKNLQEDIDKVYKAKEDIQVDIDKAAKTNKELTDTTTKAESLGKKIEVNVELVNKIKKDIDTLDTRNTTSQKNIESLTQLTSKSENIIPQMKELSQKIDNAKPLLEDVVVKDKQLKTSLEEVKKYTETLNNSKNPIKMQQDIDELKEGLKINQNLNYKGSSIVAKNTLEGRTNALKIEGRTLLNYADKNSYKKDFEYEYNSRYSFTHIKQSLKGTLNDTFFYRLSITKISECTLGSEYDDCPLICSFLGSGGYQINDLLIKDWKKIKVGETITIENNRQCTVNENDRLEISIALGIAFEKKEKEGATGKFKINNCIITKDYKSNNYFEGFKSFGEDENNKITIKSSGHNLYKGEEDLKIEPMAVDKIKIPVENFNPKNQYVISIEDYVITDKNDNWTALIGMQYTDGTNSETYLTHNKYVISQKNKEIDFFYYRNPWRVGMILKKLQIAEGEKKIPYEPRIVETKEIQLKEPLRSINELKDVLFSENGKVKVKRVIGKHIFNGKESFGNYETDGKYSKISLEKFPKIKKNTTFILNDFIKYHRDRAALELQDEYVSSTMYDDYSLMVCVKTERLKENTKQAFIDWLKENKFKIYFEMDKEEIEEVENIYDLNLDTFNNTSYFSIENCLKGDLDFSVPSNIVTLLQNNAKEVNKIWEVINKLLIPGVIDLNKNLAMTKVKNKLI